jgi:hypothetical protein
MKKTWLYELNNEKFITISALNEKGEKRWIKFWPINPSQLTTVAVILDKPDEVQWKVKESHLEEVNPVTYEKNYLPVSTAGSVSILTGVTEFSKNPDAKVFVFPLDPLDPKNKVSNVEVIGHLGTATTFSVKVDAPTWLGYVSTSGTVTKVQ